LKNSLPKIIKKIATLLTGTVLAQIIVIAVTPILSRLYSPSYFSQLGVFVALSTSIGSLVSLRYEYVIMLENVKIELEKRKLIFLPIFVSFILTLLFTIIYLILSYFDFDFKLDEKIGNIYYLLPISIFIYSLVQIFQFFHAKNENYNIISLAKVGRASLVNSIQFALKIFPAIGLVLGNFLGVTGEILILIFHKRSKSLIVDFNYIRKMAVKYKKQATYDSFANALNIVTINLPTIVFAYYFTTEFAGSYFQTQKIMAIPLGMIGIAVSQVFLQEITGIEDIKQKKDSFFNVLNKLYLFATILFIIILLIGPQVIVFVLGENWKITGDILFLITPWMYFNFIVSPIASMVNVLQIQEKGFLVSLIGAILRISALWIGINYFNNPLNTVLLFSLSSALFYILYLFIIMKKMEMKIINWVIKIIFIPTLLFYLIYTFSS